MDQKLEHVEVTLGNLEKKRNSPKEKAHRKLQSELLGAAKEGSKISDQWSVDIIDHN